MPAYGDDELNEISIDDQTAELLRKIADAGEDPIAVARIMGIERSEFERFLKETHREEDPAAQALLKAAQAQNRPIQNTANHMQHSASRAQNPGQAPQGIAVAQGRPKRCALPIQATGEREIIVRTPDTPRKVHPIVFVHGAWHGAWCWDEYFLDYFAQRGYQVYALSFRHHGTSSGTKSLRSCRIADYVADLAAVTKILPVQPILVGHSMGGLVVQKYLETITSPAGILLASVPSQGALRATLRTVRRIPWRFLKANLQLRLYPLVETPQLTREAFFSPTIANDTLQKYFRFIQDESYLAFLDMVVLNLPKPKRVKAPMLVLGGERDAIFHPHEIHATAAAYGTQAVLFQHMAHDMMLEPGWEVVANTIVDWLEKQGL